MCERWQAANDSCTFMPVLFTNPWEASEWSAIAVKGNIYLAGTKTLISSRTMEELCSEKI